MLTFEHFQKSYGPNRILGIDKLMLEAGIHWIQGTNGSGKSTLLKAIAGLIHFHGSIVLENRFNLKKQPVAYRQQINFAESEPLYPGYFNGWDMIRLFAKAKKAPDNQITQLVEGLGMVEYLNEPLAGYSSGMLKKLSLVLGFLGQPSLILLDEPFITLDQAALNQLAEWIRDTHLLKNVNFLITSHQTIPLSIPLTRTFLLSNQQLQLRN
ncbi:ABC-2 type transport system ATP-binding protein [bacterium A37T11]|nr:ABC-2 type transport system ATP-binding protein [bacterium A37T11]